MVNWITKFLNGWKEITRAFEETLVDNISATIPWLAPIIPSYIAFVNLTEILNFSETIGWIGAIVVEFLGLATVSTTFWLWNYNDAKKDRDKEAPVLVSIYTAGFYIFVVIVVNVVLDIGKSPFTHILAKALLSTLSIVAAVTLSIRSQHARRLSEIEKEKKERKEEKLKRKLTNNLPELSGNNDISNNDWRMLPDEDKKTISALTKNDVMQKYNVSDRTARNWINKSFGLIGNTNGKTKIIETTD